MIGAGGLITTGGLIITGVGSGVAGAVPPTLGPESLGRPGTGLRGPPGTGRGHGVLYPGPGSFAPPPSLGGVLSLLALSLGGVLSLPPGGGVILPPPGG